MNSNCQLTVTQNSKIMIIKNRNIIPDNIEDWSDRELQESINWLKQNCHNNKRNLYISLIANEFNRRREMKEIMKFYDKNKQFILKTMGDGKYEP